MFGGPLEEPILQQVKEEAQIHLNGEDELNAIWSALMSALEIWKLQHGNRKPIDGSTLGGLLGGNPKRIPFVKAKPWQCTGNPFETATSLTLRLLHESNPEVAKVSKAATEKKLMAVLLIKAGDRQLVDWFYAYRRMLWVQIPEARKAGAYGTLLEHWDKIKAGERQKVNLAKGPKAAAVSRIAKGQSNQANVKKAIDDLFLTPTRIGHSMTNQQIVLFLVTRNLTYGYKKTSLLQLTKTHAAPHRKAEKQRVDSQLLGR